MTTMTGDIRHQLTLRYDRYVRKLFIASALMMSLIILSIIGFVGQQGLALFQSISPAEFFFSGKWDPSEGQFGALSFILGSLFSTLLAVALSTPLGLAGAIFLAKIAPSSVCAWMRPAIGLYVAIPSVVYGFLGLTILVPFIREVFHVGTGFGLLSSSLILAVMILPTIISLSEDAIRAVPVSLEEASLALGATRWQTIWHILLPGALPGIMTSIILATARAIGETMAVQMVIGNTPLLPLSLFTPTATLTSEIVVEMGNTPFGSAWSNALFFMALFLLILSLIMILLIRFITGRRRYA